MKRERYTDFDDPDGRGPGMIARIGKIGLGVKVATGLQKALDNLSGRLAAFQNALAGLAVPAPSATDRSVPA